MYYHMKTLSEIKHIFAGLKKELLKKYKVKAIGIFGSYAKNINHAKSDIDILVEFENGYKTFDNYMELKFLLEDKLDAKVDLVLKNVVKKEIKEHILSEAVYV